MKGSQQAGWIEVADATDVRLVDSGRFDRLVGTLPDPSRQFPQTVFCIGGQEKRRAIDHFFPGHDLQQVRPSLDGLADLHLDISRSHLDSPIFFVDCTLEGLVRVKTRTGQRSRKPSGPHSSVLTFPRRNNTILTRLLFPFADVICVFADDLGGLDVALTYLDAWSAGEIAATTPWRARPRVSIVTFAPLTPEAYEEQKRFNSRLRAIKYRRHFSMVRLMRFWPRSTAAGRDAALRRSILHDELATARARRKSERVLFSAQHLSWFFSRAVVHVTEKAHEPFDFIKASRSLRPLHSRYADQMGKFLRLASCHDIDADIVTEMVASSIVLDAYPPATHSE